MINVLCSLFRFREIKEVLAIGKNLKFSFSVKYCTNMIPAAKSIVKGKNKDDRLTHCIAKFKKVMSL